MNMKNFLKGAFAVAALAGAQVFAQEAAPEVKEEKICGLIPDSISLSMQYKSRYISDGFVINPDSMLFGSFDLGWDLTSHDGIYIGIWGANDLNHYNEDSGIKYEPEEFDYYIGYWYEFGDIPGIQSLTLDLSYTYWDYPSRTGWEGVGEQQNTIALDITAGCFLQPGVTINWDPENEKLYFKLHVGYDYEVEDVKGLSLSTGLAMFVGNGHYVAGKGVMDWDDDVPVDSYDRSAITTLIWDVALTYAVNDHISFGPFASLNFAVDHNVRDTWKANDNSKSGCNTLWGFGGKISF
ncbi:MAG: hypothetical protein IKP00_07230 [Victivallales bacterium]|nr:hypothetical protein [Victivallales bacterium]